MYGDKLISEYGRTEGRRRDVVGKVHTAPFGNLILEAGKCIAPEGSPSRGWESTGHIVMKPSEAFAFAAEIVKALARHETNDAELIQKCGGIVEFEQIVNRLKEKADDLETAEAEAGRDEEVAA
jgi:hypothetical protein